MDPALGQPQHGVETGLAPDLLVQMHETMLRTRLLEERLIRMVKQGDGYFWIGGPGEEAFNVPLGMLVHKGEGPAYDYLHLHYRSSGTLLAMGADPVDALRQMKSTASDPYSGGRNFCAHYSARKWNVVPVSSPIEVQYVMAPGTAMAQKRLGGKGITIVQGGDAGSAAQKEALLPAVAGGDAPPRLPASGRAEGHVQVRRAGRAGRGGRALAVVGARPRELHVVLRGERRAAARRGSGGGLRVGAGDRAGRSSTGSLLLFWHIAFL